MTTNTTNQATSIDTPEFWTLLNAREEGAMDDAHAEELEQAIIAHIDAKIAQAGDDWRDRAYVLEARLGEVMEKRDELRDLATSAESRLAEIQRGVEGFIAYVEKNPDSIFCTTKTGFQSVLETLGGILTRPTKSDTSGLPG